MAEVGTIFESGAKELLDNPLLRKEMLDERAYQLNIALKSVNRNTLVVLPTALGKTVISVFVAAHHLYNFRGKKVLIMAPTKPLVLQHRDSFQKLLKLRDGDIEVLTGKTTPGQRMRAWNGKARAYFATPQVVSNDRKHGLRLDDFSLLVFDECHRARKNYAYTRVAEAYVREAGYPVILAMTASPGADKSKIEDLCKSLFVERIEVRAEEDPDVQPYVSPVGVEWKLVRLPESYSEVGKLLKEMLDRRLKSLSMMGVIRKDPSFIFRSDLLEAGEKLRRSLGFGKNKGRIFGALILQSSALSIYHAMGLLESQGPETMRKFLERVKNSAKKSHRSVAIEMESKGVFEMMDSGLEEHPKISALEKTVGEQLSSNSDSKIMIFTQYRDTSSHIVERLSKTGLPVERFVGQASKEGEPGMNQDEQAELLGRFRKGEVRILVATSIGEEGLDIPNVDMVLFYEPVPSEIRYIQRKGRTGRGNFGKVVILAAEDTIDTSYLRSTGKKVERMRRAIKRLNMELSPIVRFGGAPAPDPMRQEDFTEIVESTPTEGHRRVRRDPEDRKAEIREFNREVRKVSKLLLDRVLRSGESGITLEEFASTAGSEGYSWESIKEAADILLKSEQVDESKGRLVPPAVGLPGRPGLEMHSFEVERVLSGRAVLLVDEKWRSVLFPESYNGPKHLIKKGVRFEAAADFYRQDGKVHTRIYAIKNVLS